jgi:hypothetical protein
VGKPPPSAAYTTVALLPARTSTYARSSRLRALASFEHLRTVIGTLDPTFQVTCVALSLLEDDREWIDCLTEASTFAGGPQLRALFCGGVGLRPYSGPGSPVGPFCC